MAKLLAIVLLLFPASGVASDHDRYDDRDEAVILGDTVVTGKRGVSVSGADMEINECVSSFSWLFGIVQEVRTNPLCVAKQLEAEGKYQAAAELRCSVRRVRKAYGSREDCEVALLTEIEPEPPDLGQLYDRAAREAEPLPEEQLEQQRQDTQAYIDERFDRLERINREAASRKRQERDVDNAYLRELADEIKAIDQPREVADNE